MPNDLDVLRERWQSAKQELKVNNPTNPRVKQLLKAFDQGLGPALDKFMAAAKARKVADARKYAEQAQKIIKDYEAKVRAIPAEDWDDGNKARASRQWAIATLGALKDVINKVMTGIEPKQKTGAK